MPHVNSMTQRDAVMFFRQQRKEDRKIIRIEFLRRRELPVDDAELLLQLGHTARQKLFDGWSCFREHTAISRKARPLQREDETVRCLIVPFAKAFRLLRTIEGTVDLDAAKLRACIFKLALLCQTFRIEAAAPFWKNPPANADTDRRLCHPGVSL